MYQWRKDTVKHSFADAKQHLGLCYARFCKLEKVRVQYLLAAVCQNLIRIALAMS
ncbi:hypothetical protein [Vreelandella neptunia]|uniref:hypothetical protein n=1 Tax=Vreelandella neptunia TaxID=115551 RepID=UPI003CC9191B